MSHRELIQQHCSAHRLNKRCTLTNIGPQQIIQINFEEFDLEIGYDSLAIGDAGEGGESKRVVEG